MGDEGRLPVELELLLLRDKESDGRLDREGVGRLKFRPLLRGEE